MLMRPLMAMFISRLIALKITVDYLAKNKRNWKLEPELKLTKLSKTQWILCCGNRQNKTNQLGILIGRRADLAGISNVRQCRQLVWEKALIFMAAGWIYSFRIMKMKSRNQKRRMVISL